MRNLILVEKPGRELGFAGLVQRHPEDHWVLAVICPGDDLSARAESLATSAALMGVAECLYLRCPSLPNDLLPVEFVSMRLEGLGEFDRVYTHNCMSDHWGECITAAAAGSVYEEIWVASCVRPPDETVVLTASEHQRKLEAANAVYSAALESREIQTADLSAVESYCRIPGRSVVRYFSAVLCPPVYDPLDPLDAAVHTHERIRCFMPAPMIDPVDAWSLESSDYEQARHRLEIAVLGRIEWKSIIEIGACTGVFTLQLLESFPEREVIACEPYEPFVRELLFRVGDRAHVLHAGAAGHLPDADVVFASSCLYYARPFPLELLRGSARYFVFSHCRRYQKRVITPCMLTMNFRLLSEDVLPAQVEPAYGLIDIKDGTIVQVWESAANIK